MIAINFTYIYFIYSRSRLYIQGKINEKKKKQREKDASTKV